MLKVEIENLADAMKVLGQLPANMQRKVFIPALRKASKPMLAAAKSHAPKRSGMLAKSLRIVSLKKWSETLSEVAIQPVFKLFKTGGINQYYGAMIIGGTTERTPKKGKFLAFEGRDGKMVFTKKAKALPARPFIEESFNATSDTVGNSFAGEVATATEKFINTKFQ